MRAHDNPFSTDRLLKLRYLPQNETWDGIYRRLEALRFHAAIVGPEGSGKTTLLEDLQPFLRASGFAPHLIYLSTEARPIKLQRLAAILPQANPSCAVLLDSAELLGRAAWAYCRWRLRNAGGVIITAHCAGRLPILVKCSTSPELLRLLLDKLCVADHSRACFAEDVFLKHAGNIRAALLDYYDQFARV
ncbi:MAG TPA: hypothetical protein PLP17_00475 [Oligoflexia bacterium]|nr:hypothetical protein [Oligoflexia bacterium]